MNIDAVYADHVAKARRLPDIAPEPLLVWRVAGHIISVHRAAGSAELWLFSSDRSGSVRGPMDARSALMMLGTDTWLVGGVERPGTWIHVIEPQGSDCVAGPGFWLCAVPVGVLRVKALITAPDGDEIVEIDVPSI